MWRRSSGILLCAGMLRLQPAPFDHKLHAPLQLDCTLCHAAARTGNRAGYPAAATCLGCHPRMDAGKGDKMEPERSVYQLAEFVHFSHARHARAKLVCQTCHGRVAAMDEVKQVLPMTMKACITCHRAMRATTRCAKCHQLAGQ